MTQTPDQTLEQTPEQCQEQTLDLCLIGIGTGNPDHITAEAVKAMNGADLILIPLKGEDKAELAALRQQICRACVTNPATRIVGFDLPVRDPATRIT